MGAINDPLNSPKLADPNVAGAATPVASERGHMLDKTATKKDADTQAVATGQADVKAAAADKPTIPPSQEATTDAQIAVLSAIAAWMAPSLTTALFSAEMKNAMAQQSIQLQSSLQELEAQSQIFTNSVKSAQYTSQETMNNAFKELMQGVSSLASGIVSLKGAADTAGNMGKAKTEIDAEMKKEMDAQQLKVSQLQSRDLQKPIGAGDTAEEIGQQHAQQIKDVPKDTQEAMDKLKSLESDKEQKIRQRAGTYDQINQMTTTGLTSVINAASSAVQAGIDMNTAQLQLMQKTLDAIVQAFTQLEQNDQSTANAAAQAQVTIAQFLQQTLSQMSKSFQGQPT